MSENTTITNTLLKPEAIKAYIIMGICIIVIIVLCLTLRDSIAIQYSMLGVITGGCLLSMAVYCKYYDVELLCRVLCNREDYEDDSSARSLEVHTDDSTDADL